MRIAGSKMGNPVTEQTSCKAGRLPELTDDLLRRVPPLSHRVILPPSAPRTLGLSQRPDPPTGSRRWSSAVTPVVERVDGVVNVGDETVKVVGFFSESEIISSFDAPVQPFGVAVLNQGAPAPVPA